VNATSSAIDALDRVLGGFPAIAVAVSGGVDSLTLATLAHRRMTAPVAMFHAVSAAVPAEATERVRRLGAREGWTLSLVDAAEFSDPQYRANPVNRCFHCKSHLYDAIAGYTLYPIVSGTNLDDLGEYRPGLDAARSRAVRHPFVEAGIGKDCLRAIARSLGLGAIAELPASPCLSSRIETAIVIEPDVLELVHAIETFVRQATQAATVRCRVRAEGMVIELDAASLAGLSAGKEADIRANAQNFMDRRGRSYQLKFEPYRNGSAFVHRSGSSPVARP
jgi:uncharacterized protein